MHRLQQSTLIALLRRFIAAGSIALVVLLGWLSSSPSLHEQLHAHDHATTTEHGDTCAVALFAQGLAAPLDTAVIDAPVCVASETRLFSTTELLLIPARYLRQPERGPPAC